MISRFHLLRNVGQFDSVDECRDIPLSRITLVYAENGRGKTTLAAILRSLGANNPEPIEERRRLASEHPPHVALECQEGIQRIFQDGSWTNPHPALAVFDDIFVDENVYSGLNVASGHRQNLHDLILGSQGVTLGQRAQELAEEIKTHNANLRTMSAAIPAQARGPLSVDDFCSLPPHADIDSEIHTAEQSLAAIGEQTTIRDMPQFEVLSLPLIDLDEIERVLGMDLPGMEEAAAARVQEHISKLARDGERWAAQGMTHAQSIGEVGEGELCPFCAQGLGASPVFGHYR